MEKILVKWCDGRSMGMTSFIKRSAVKEGMIAVEERLVVVWRKTKKVYNAEVIRVPSSASRSEETSASKSDEPSTVSKNKETLAASRNEETLAASSSDVPPTVSKSKTPAVTKRGTFCF